MGISKEKANTIIGNFKNKSILVIGDLILDKYLWGNVDRISPEAPVPVVDVKEETSNLGGACNVAWNVSNLGINTTIIGVVGNDENGKILNEMLNSKNIDTALVIDNTRPTIEKTRIIAVSQQLVRIDRESKEKLSRGVISNLIKLIKEHIKKVDAVIISDYGKGVINKRIMNTILSYKIPVFIDPKPSNFNLYKHATIITPNKKEAYESIKAEKKVPLEQVGEKIMKRLNLEHLLITLGAEGMALFSKNGIKRIPAKARKVFDVTGAGDTVISVLTASKISGASWEEACILANYAGGWVVGEIGTVAIDTDTLLSLITE